MSAQVVLQNYMFERFLKCLSKSAYKDKFILNCKLEKNDVWHYNKCKVKRKNGNNIKRGIFKWYNSN